jgi:hypothetical protein
LNATRHPSGIRVVRREKAHELGPADDEADLLGVLATELRAERITDVRAVVFDWRDDGCHLVVHCNSYVLLREVGVGI